MTYNFHIACNCPQYSPNTANYCKSTFSALSLFRISLFNRISPRHAIWRGITRYRNTFRAYRDRTVRKASILDRVSHKKIVVPFIFNVTRVARRMLAFSTWVARNERRTPTQCRWVGRDTDRIPARSTNRSLAPQLRRLYVRFYDCAASPRAYMRGFGFAYANERPRTKGKRYEPGARSSNN